MRRAFNAATAVIILLLITAAGPADAHMPRKCDKLWLNSAETVRVVVREGKKIGALAGADTSQLPTVGIHEYLRFAKQVRLLLVAQREMFLALAPALECIDGR